MQKSTDQTFLVEEKLTRPKRRKSNFLFLPMIVIGGGIGLLAGYGALTLITGKNPLQANEPVEKVGPSPLVPGEPQPKPDRPLAAHVSGIDNSSAPKPPHNQEQAEQESLKPLPPPKFAPAPAPQPDADQKRMAAPQDPKPRDPADAEKPSAIVTLALDKSVIRAMAETDKPEATLCDIGFSHNLLQRGDSRTGYETVAEKLTRGKQTIELGANITGAGAAIQVEIIRRTNMVICELRPLYSLPSGDIQPLTVTRGTTQYKQLSKSLAAAKSARETLPQMRSALSQLKSDLTTAQRNMGANGNTPAETGAVRNVATAQANKLSLQVNNATKKVAAAERLAAQENDIGRDLEKLDEIAEYAKGIASAATVSVRFHSDGITIPATVK